MRKTGIRLCLTGVAVVCLAALSAYAASGPKLQILHSFAGKSDGNSPHAALLADKAGNLYGTTQVGGRSNCLSGQYGCGTVFELSPPQGSGTTWTENVLYRFSGGSDGYYAYGKLISDQTGNLYGTTYFGGDFSTQLCMKSGCGVLFKLSPPTVSGQAWKETVLHSFVGTDGAHPSAGLVFDGDGNLYGTTYGGGSSSICGNVFELSPPNSNGASWSFTDLHDFSSNDGCLSLSDLIFDSIGNIYGTTCAGGSGSGGVAFELSPPGTQGGPWIDTTIYNFPLDSCPSAGLTFDSVGNLYGTAGGDAFQLTPSPPGLWTETVIGRFFSPQSVILIDSAGELYGTDAGKVCGSVFRLTDQDGSWTQDQYKFFNHGGQPCVSTAGLIFNADESSVYGTSEFGGTFKKGSVFVITK
jgi:uncharacterized repeat protein (TIGR03803 family)